MTSVERLRAIHTALLAALDGPALEQLALLYLGKPLEHIAGDGDLEQRTGELIAWAEARGAVEKVLAGALALNPTNPELQRLLAESRTSRRTMDDFHSEHKIGSGLPRLERKIDDLTDAVNRLATRVSVLEYQVKHAPGLWFIALLVAVILIAACVFAWGGRLG